jgi:hypothetical protein
MLERAGMLFAEPERGGQFSVSFGGHVSGSLDGIILSGVPGAEKSPHVWENKTHRLKSFTHLIANGLQKSKPIHWAQCHAYMHGTHAKDFQGPRLVKRALYTGVCKDDDRIYTERVRYEPEAAAKLEARSHAIVNEPGPPLGISTDATWYQCKMCSGHDLCHGSRITREVNCRTCAHSTPETDGTWSCARFGGAMPVAWQRQAHECHAMHPGLVPWEVVDVVDGVPVFETEFGPVRGSEQLVMLRKKV